MVEIAGKKFEWVLLHIRNGEQFMGLLPVPEGKKDDDKDYRRDLANDTMARKTFIELAAPHQVITTDGQSGPAMTAMPLAMGDKKIYLRGTEVLFLQFCDEKSPLVQKIRGGMADIKEPGDDVAKTAGGIILPGAGIPK